MRIALTVVATLSCSVMLIAADPFVGTWKLNVEKSKLTGSKVTLVNETMTISKTGPNTFRVTSDSVSKSRQTLHVDTIRILDGHEHFPSDFSFQHRGISEIYEEVDPSTRKLIRKRYGKIIGESRLTVSPDADLMTDHRTYPRDRIQVFERQ